MARCSQDPLANMLRSRAMTTAVFAGPCGSWLLYAFAHTALPPNVDTRNKVCYWLFAGVLSVIMSWSLLTILAPQKNESYSRIEKLGPTAVGEVNAVISGQAPAFRSPKLAISPYWVVYSKGFRVRAIRTSEVVWMYQKVLTTTVALVPAKKDHSLVIITPTQRIEATVSGRYIHEAIQAAAKMCPNASVGFDAKLRKMLDRKKKRPQALAQLAAEAQQRQTANTFSFIPPFQQPQEYY
jgi:hypothetical protein